jgi:hypothetical protein
MGKIYCISSSIALIWRTCKFLRFEWHCYQLKQSCSCAKAPPRNVKKRTWGYICMQFRFKHEMEVSDSSTLWTLYPPSPARVKTSYPVEVRTPNIYKMYTKILSHCWNMNTDSPQSSNRVKLEKQQLRNLRFPLRCCFAGLQTCQGAKHPGTPAS